MAIGHFQFGWRSLNYVHSSCVFLPIVNTLHVFNIFLMPLGCHVMPENFMMRRTKQTKQVFWWLLACMIPLRQVCTGRQRRGHGAGRSRKKQPTGLFCCSQWTAQGTELPGCLIMFKLLFRYSCVYFSRGITFSKTESWPYFLCFSCLLKLEKGSNFCS